MAEISATAASRNFKAVLDAVEHHGETFTVMRRGKVVAEVHPARRGRGAEVKAFLRLRRADGTFADDIRSVRDLLRLDDPV